MNLKEMISDIGGDGSKIGILLGNGKGIFGPARLPSLIKPEELVNLGRICELFATISGFQIVVQANGETIVCNPTEDIWTKKKDIDINIKPTNADGN